MRALLDSYLYFLTRYPKTVLFMIVTVMLILAAGLPNFKLDASADSLTLETDTDLDYYRQVSKNFDSGDFIVVTFKPNDPLFSTQSLKTLGNLQADLAKIDGVSSINSILNVPLLYSPKRSLAETIGEVRTLEKGNVDISLAKNEFLTSPIYNQLILNSTGTITALQLNLALDKQYIDLVRARDELQAKKNDSDFTAQDQVTLDKMRAAFLTYRTLSEERSRERIVKIREVTQKYQPKAQIFIGGVSMITADMVSFIRADLMVFGLAVLAFMVVTLIAIFRSLRFVILPLSVCMVSVVMMLGYISWLDWRLTVISSNFVALLLILALANTIHLVVRYREYNMSHPDWTHEKRIQETLRFMAKPCLYTALTTVVAFASLVVSGIRPVIDFGWMMTIGLVVALVLAFMIIPAGLMLFGDPLKKQAQQKDTKDKTLNEALLSVNGTQVKQTNNTAFTQHFSRLVETRGGTVVVGAAVVLCLSIWGITRLDVENKFIDYFKDDTEIHQGLSVIDNELGGTTTLEIIISSDEMRVVVVEPSSPEEPDPFDVVDPFGEASLESDPFSEGDSSPPSVWMTRAGLQKIEKLHNYLDAQPETGVVRSLATLYWVGKDLNDSLSDFELALMQKTLPQDVKNVLLLPYLDVANDTARITIRVKDLYPNLKRQALVDRFKAHIEQADYINSDNVRFTGLLVLYNNMLQSLFSSQIVTLAAVFLAIFIMFVILFRSVTLAVVAIIPNALAAGSVLGLMGLAGLPLDMMTITVASITVGIGVDDTIHYIHRFKEEFKEKRNYISAMHHAHGSIGRAMYYTSVIIVFGFSIMMLSQFIPTIYFGLLTAFAMFSALMGALILLPKLILFTQPFGEEDTDSAIS